MDHPSPEEQPASVPGGAVPSKKRDPLRDARLRYLRWAREDLARYGIDFTRI